jgi:hypothetical protein
MRARLTSKAALVLALVLVATSVSFDRAEAAASCTAALNGAQEVPPTTSPATGTGTVELNATEDTIVVNLSFSGLVAAQTAAHIHAPAPAGTNAPIVVTFPLGQLSNQSFSVTPTIAQQIKTGQSYFNVHTPTFPGGEIRGQILCQVVTPVVPELSTVLMFGTGLAGLGGYALTRARAARSRRRPDRA